MKRCHPPRPCNNCPFRREGGVRLYPARVCEIVEAVAPNNGQGASFACHKTTGAAGTPVKGSMLECTGGLIFAYKQGVTSQLTRIMERLGLVDEKLALGNDDWPAILDDLDEMLETARRSRQPRGRRRLA